MTDGLSGSRGIFKKNYWKHTDRVGAGNITKSRRSEAGN